MNDDIRFRRLYGDGLHASAPTHAPDRLSTTIKSETERMAPRPRWLALIKEPPMRTNSRLAVGSPTWRVAAIIVATVLVAALVVGASFAGSQILFAKDGFIVDASGGGTHTSIAAAVAEAEDGYEIFVRPGTYEEAFELDKTISIIGEGPVDQIVVMAPEGGPTAEYSSSSLPDPYAIHITGGEPTISGMTFRGQSSELIVTGGTATLEGLVLEDVGRAFDGVILSVAGSSVLADGPDSHLIIRNSEVRRGGPIATFGDAVATIESNVLEGGPHLFLRGIGPGSAVVGNDVSGTAKYGLNIHDTSGVAIEGNTFADSGDVAIRVRDGGDGLVARNNVVGGDTKSGIEIGAADGLRLIENVVTDTQFGVHWQSGDGTIEGNDASNNASGIMITSGSPTVVGNVACDNANSNFVVAAGSPDIGENEFCPEPGEQ